MSNQVRRLGNGDVIQIRTGVIQGIGPQGPTGPAGPAGRTGPQGAQGTPGPTGYVDESVTEATGNGSVSNVTNTLLPFASLTRDEGSIYTNSTTLTVPVGGWQGTVWVRFTKRSGVTGTGSRRVEALLNGTVVSAVCVAAAPDQDTDLMLPFTVAPTTGQTMQFRAYQSDGASLATTQRLWVSRIGAGIQGPQGPQGPSGPQGVPGPQGPAGPSGSLATNTTFTDIGG